jgi:hypothetical protein
VTRHSLDVLAFDDLTLGDEWESAGRTVTESDVVLFAGLSGDYNPLHSNHKVADKGPFGRPVAHGLLGLTIATGLISTSPRVDTLAFLAILEWKFLLPSLSATLSQSFPGLTLLSPRHEVAEASLPGTARSSIKTGRSCSKGKPRPWSGADHFPGQPEGARSRLTDEGLFEPAAKSPFPPSFIPSSSEIDQHFSCGK